MNLNLQPGNLKIKKDGENLYIFDRLRKKFVAVTPEEFVRQNFVNYLIDNLNYPEALMGNEISLIQNGIKRRCDTLVTDHNGNPIMIIEYKAPNIHITQETFNQITRYNSVFLAKYLTIFNGNELYCCKIDIENKKVAFLNELPSYDML